MNDKLGRTPSVQVRCPKHHKPGVPATGTPVLEKGKYLKVRHYSAKKHASTKKGGMTTCYLGRIRSDRLDMVLKNMPDGDARKEIDRIIDELEYNYLKRKAAAAGPPQSALLGQILRQLTELVNRVSTHPALLTNLFCPHCNNPITVSRTAKNRYRIYIRREQSS